MAASKIKKKNRLFLLFIVVFLLGLVINFPARLAWSLAKDYAPLPKDWQIEQINGSLWQGDALVRHRFDATDLELQIRWEFGPSVYLSQGLPLKLNLYHPGTDLVLLAGLDGLSGVKTELQGQVHPLLLNPFLKQNQAWIEGLIAFRNVRIAYGFDKTVTATGAMSWQGGGTYFLGNKKPMLIPYPPLALRFSTEKAGASAHLTTQDNDAPLAEFGLANNGWFSAKVFGLLKQVVPKLPMPRRAATEALVKYKEKVW